MKKVFAILMAVAIVLSLAVTAIADEPTGSITITNATKDQTYSIYKIFDASIQLGTDGKAEAVAYSIKPDNQFFSALFGADGTTENAYFTYEPSTGAVAKKAAAVDTEVIAYLTQLVGNGATAAAAPVTATSDTVKFDNLPYGYYLVKSTLGTAVTINSNTPNVEVIDKNQKPAPFFKKEIATSFDATGNPLTWAAENSAAIGDVVTYKISFAATNYDGDKLIKYYQIHDTKGDALHAAFESVQVSVGGVRLNKGYYLCAEEQRESLNAANWEFLGDWGNTEKLRKNADWYLVQLSSSEFRITIPWLTGHDVVDVKDPNTGKVISYSLTYADNAESKFNSPVNVEIMYQAAIEAHATIGGTVSTNLFNRAYASWTSEHETGSSETSRVETKVYGIGLLKDDGSTGINLAGAEFRIYSDSACTKPVYVIPTKIDGVYIVDSLNTPSSLISDQCDNLSRKLYADKLAGYLGTNEQDNLVVSQINGKLVVLGLEAGTYYLKEVKAPNGYNSLSTPVEIRAGEGIKGFPIFADINGKVADTQTDDGTHHEYIYQLTSTIVHNSKGVELPSTGGEGTVLLITIGSILAIVFAVFLITNKKMSIYND